jgi:hypothetical protein
MRSGGPGGSEKAMEGRGSEIGGSVFGLFA